MQAAKLIISVAGNIGPWQLRPSHIYEIDSFITGQGLAHATRASRAVVVASLLRWLWMYHGAPKLDELVTKHPGRRPRNVTATEEERKRMLEAAPLYLKLYILLCSDLAIRSGTVAKLRPANYDNERGVLTFTTKMGEKLTLPVTDEIKEIMHCCDMENEIPFVKQLWMKGSNHRPGYNPKITTTSNTFNNHFARLRESVGIKRKLTPHDLRRTTAVKMLEATGDIRDVQALLGHRSLQSTIWYLDHDLRPVKRSTLELIKRPTWRKEESA